MNDVDQTSAGQASGQGTSAPPVAPVKPRTRVHHGIEFVDDYEWIRDLDDPDTLAYLEAENAWTDARTAHLAGLRDELFEDVKARTQETDQEVPRLVLHETASGPAAYWYYRRTVEGQQYELHCRALAADPGSVPDTEALSGSDAEEVLLDENELARGQEFFALGERTVSPSGRFYAYSTDTTGGEVFTVRVRDLQSGELLPDIVEGIQYGLEFLTDDDLFYTVPDDAWRSFEVRRHRLGEGAGDDTVVYTDSDERFYVGISTSRDRKWLLIGSESTLTTEWSLLSADDVTAAPRVVARRREGVDYRVEVAGDRLLIVHDDGAPDFELAQAPLDSTGPADWRAVLPHEPGVRLLDVDAYDGHAVVSRRREGLSGLHIIPRDERGEFGEGADLPIGEELYAVRHESGANVSDTAVRYAWTSLVTPHTVAEYDVATGRSRTLKTTPVLDHPVHGAYRPEDYVQRREWATADDGTMVPISVVYRKDALVDGPRPALLYAYGSYEACSDPVFSIERLSLLDRGFVFAIAHIRGGGERGRDWYEQGRVLNKRNSFTDFIACADRLVGADYTTADRLAAEGRSAGGLLMGALANLAPDRFRAIHAGVPFVDALTTTLNPEFPLIVHEWEEWGDPLHDPEVYHYMASYTPYENVAEVEYPAILATTSVNDIRVYYVEPAKWVARLRTRALNGADRPILLRTELVAGHGGPSGRYGEWRHSAFILAWFIDQIGG